MYIVLDYLVWRRENSLPACSAYDITHKAPNLTTSQRQQRIGEVLKLLEEGGLVNAQRFENAGYWTVTDRGMQWYKTIAKSFYAVFSPTP